MDQNLAAGIATQWLMNAQTDVTRYAIFAIGVWFVLWVILAGLLLRDPKLQRCGATGVTPVRNLVQPDFRHRSAAASMTVACPSEVEEGCIRRRVARWTRCVR